MWARTNLLIRKKTLITVSFLATMALLVSSAYAVTTTSIEVETNTDETNGVEVEGETTVGQEADQSSSEESNGAGTSEQDDSIVAKPKDPISPISPVANSSESQARGSDNAGASYATSSDTTAEEDAVIINEGSQEENESDVRIRIRNSSDSEINGDDVENDNMEFRLEIRESTSAD